MRESGRAVDEEWGMGEGKDDQQEAYCRTEEEKIENGEDENGQEDKTPEKKRNMKLRVRNVEWRK